MSNVRPTRMPTILSHAAVPLALGLGLGSRVVPPRLLMVGVVAAVLPDLDVLAFRLHVAYASTFGHRGASHSIVFALILGLLASLLALQFRAKRRIAFSFVAFCAASHGVLDMFTNGGHGVPLWWPVSGERFFFPWQVIEASPLSVRRIFGGRGIEVLQSELLWVWLPAAVACAALLLFRHQGSNPSVKGTSRRRAAPYVER
jgi:inner membrane protein